MTPQAPEPFPCNTPQTLMRDVNLEAIGGLGRLNARGVAQLKGDLAAGGFGQHEGQHGWAAISHEEVGQAGTERGEMRGQEANRGGGDRSQRFSSRRGVRLAT